MCALRDRISHHTVDAGRSERKRNQSKDIKEKHCEPLRSDRLAHLVVEGLHLSYWLVLINYSNLTLDRPNEG
jgi:hypothetical protein